MASHVDRPYIRANDAAGDAPLLILKFLVISKYTTYHNRLKRQGGISYRHHVLGSGALKYVVHLMLTRTHHW